MVSPRVDAPGGIASVVGTLMRSELCERFTCELVETVGSGSAIERSWWTLRSMVSGLRAIRRLPRGSIVHVHVAQKGSFWRKAFLARAAYRAGHRVVVHVHGSRFHSFAAGGGKRRLRTVRRVLERADRVIVLSDTWRGRIAELAPEARTVVVENPVVIPELEAPGAHAAGILFLGRLGERKGVPTLVSALGKLQREGIRTPVTLAGDGDIEGTRAAIEQLPFPTDVSVPGWVDAGRVASELLPSHGIFCLPSRDEGQPIALLEAMARGMACVVTPVGGIPDTVTDGVDALIVAVDDSDDLARALGALIRDEDFRVRLGTHARESAVRRFGVDVAVEALSAVYAELGLQPQEVSRDD